MPFNVEKPPTNVNPQPTDTGNGLSEVSPKIIFADPFLIAQPPSARDKDTPATNTASPNSTDIQPQNINLTSTPNWLITLCDRELFKQKEEGNRDEAEDCERPTNKQSVLSRLALHGHYNLFKGPEVNRLIEVLKRVAGADIPLEEATKLQDIKQYKFSLPDWNMGRRPRWSVKMHQPTLETLGIAVASLSLQQTSSYVQLCLAAGLADSKYHREEYRQKITAYIEEWKRGMVSNAIVIEKALTSFEAGQ